MDQYYKILGIEPGASKEEIKQAYRDMLKVWHPDRFAQEPPRLQEKAEDNAKTINDAYEKLMSLGPEAHSRIGREQYVGRDTERSGGKTREAGGKATGQAGGEQGDFWKNQEDFRKQREEYREDFWRNREEQRRQREKLWEKLAGSHIEAGEDRDDLGEIRQSLTETHEDLEEARDGLEEVQEDLEEVQEDSEETQEDMRVAREHSRETSEDVKEVREDFVQARQYPRKDWGDFADPLTGTKRRGFLSGIKSRLVEVAIIAALIVGAALLGAYIYEHFSH